MTAKLTSSISLDATDHVETLVCPEISYPKLLNKNYTHLLFL